MKSSGMVDKGKRFLTEIAASMEPSSDEASAAAAADAGMRASSSSSQPQLTFTELLAHEGDSCSGLYKIEEESDGEKSGVSNSMKSGKRVSSQLPNLDLSLLPSRESIELLRTPRKNTTQPNQWPPFSGFRSPYFGGISPANLNAFSNQQQQGTQLTIFYSGTVNVYNVSADMAKAIMVLASSGTNTKVNSTPTSLAPPTPASIAEEIICSTPLPTRGRPAPIQPTFTMKAANLPISRKNSLQRFLEKRNDRLHARAPYAYANANNAPLRQN